jgi:hypothetical protein
LENFPQKLNIWRGQRKLMTVPLPSEADAHTYLIAELKKSGEHGEDQTADEDVEYSRHVAEQAAILP